MLNNPILKKHAPIISVTQWTPETSLPVTINKEKRFVINAIIFFVLYNDKKNKKTIEEHNRAKENI